MIFFFCLFPVISKFSFNENTYYTHTMNLMLWSGMKQSKIPEYQATRENVDAILWPMPAFFILLFPPKIIIIYCSDCVKMHANIGQTVNSSKCAIASDRERERERAKWCGVSLARANRLRFSIYMEMNALEQINYYWCTWNTQALIVNTHTYIDTRALAMQFCTEIMGRKIENLCEAKKNQHKHFQHKYYTGQLNTRTRERQHHIGIKIAVIYSLTLIKSRSFIVLKLYAGCGK